MSAIAKPANIREAAEQVADALRRAGHQALFAGGCVRDLLMGRQPADYDVATDAVPAKVSKLFRRTLLVDAQFGVVIVVLGKFQVEVATFRSESGYADGRHPEHVRFSDARQDALRRDFTINGMFMDPAGGEVIDHVGGRADLAARVIRAIGEPAERFAEDHLRMLRAVRFATVLGFRLDERTAGAIRDLASRITDVSAERIWQEWEKLLADPNRAAGFELAAASGLVAALWPDQQPRAGQIARRLARLSGQADAVTALACQFLGLRPERVHELCRDLALDNKRREAVAWLAAHVGHGGDPSSEGSTGSLDRPLDIVALKKLMANENWPRLVDLSRAQAAAAPDGHVGQPDGQPGAALAANLALAQALPPEEIAPPPLIDGADVMALEVPEGPRVGQILAAVYDAQLAGQVSSREQAMDLARQLARHPAP